MPRRTLVVAGTDISGWRGVVVYESDDQGRFRDITRGWNWSREAHQHYEVQDLRDGSYWVPASTHPPGSWAHRTAITGSSPAGTRPVNPGGTEYRPTGTYFWIPNASIPQTLTPGGTTNAVECNAPGSYPP